MKRKPFILLAVSLKNAKFAAQNTLYFQFFVPKGISFQSFSQNSAEALQISAEPPQFSAEPPQNYREAPQNYREALQKNTSVILRRMTDVFFDESLIPLHGVAVA